MDSFMQANFLVLSAGLRATYHNVVTKHIDGAELKDVVARLTALSNTLSQFVDRAVAAPQGEKALMVAQESFEDIVASLWQITWALSQQSLDVHSLCEQLKELHKKLRELEQLQESHLPLFE